MIQHRKSIFFLISVLCMAGGCQYPAYVLDSFFPAYQKPLCELATVRTAILVDDTNKQLGDPALTGTIAERVGHDLIHQKVLKEGQSVSYREIRKIQARLGDAFDQTPLDQIGTQLNASQMIHVNIDQIQLGSQMGILNPQAIITIKVMDIHQGIRIFPPISAARDIDAIAASSQGYRLVVKLPRVVQMDLDTGTHRMLMRQLANEIGIAVAKLFYKHIPDDL